jgi:hypothetical protein
MEPAPLIALLAAVAGPTGVTLGWWLGRRGQREALGRDERKSAYLAFVRASIRYRNAADDDERRALREDRWTALAEVVLVAPPAIVQTAAYFVTTGDRLLDEDLTHEQRLAVFEELWANNVEFTRLTRADLGIEAADPFAGFQPTVGTELRFGRPAPDPTP